MAGHLPNKVAAVVLRPVPSCPLQPLGRHRRLAVASSAGLNWHSTDTSALKKGVNLPEMVRLRIFLCQNVTRESQSSYDKKGCFKEGKGDGEIASFRCEKAAVIREGIKGYVDQSAWTAVPRLWPKLPRTAIYCQNSRASVAISMAACSPGAVCWVNVSPLGACPRVPAAEVSRDPVLGTRYLGHELGTNPRR